MWCGGSVAGPGVPAVSKDDAQKKLEEEMAQLFEESVCLTVQLEDGNDDALSLTIETFYPYVFNEGCQLNVEGYKVSLIGSAENIDDAQADLYVAALTSGRLPTLMEDEDGGPYGLPFKDAGEA